MRYLPALDGLRAVAILAVIGFHGGWPGFAWGGRGVDLFFAISGYLITTLLLREKERCGSIALGSFYARRALRIFPAYYVFLAGYSLISWVVFTDFRAQLPSTMLVAGTYATDVAIGWFDSQVLVAHTWSLSLEEQFYLLFPWLLVLTSRRTALRAVLAVLALAPAWRAALFFFAGVLPPYRFAYSPDTRLDAIFWGCALALLLADRAWRGAQLLQRAPYGALAVAALLFAATAWCSDRSPAFLAVAGYSLVSAACTLALAAVLLGGDRRVTRLLGAAPLRAGGRLSYALYLWHPLCVGLGGRVANHAPQGWEGAARQAAYIALSLLFALGSTFVVERPFLALKVKFSRV